MKELKDFHLGSIDAKNELLNGLDIEKERFINSFVIPPNLVVENFWNHSKYFITGLKGTGKTALLRYLSLTMEKKSHVPSEFVLFKTDIDEDFKKSLSKTANADVIEKNIDDFEGDDFESVWRWFIYNRILYSMEVKAIDLFQKSDNFDRFRAVLGAPVGKKETSGLAKLIPSIKKGQIQISKDPKLVLDFEWGNENTLNVKFTDLVRRADELFPLLTPAAGSLNLFFDELELNSIKKSQYIRDSKLIRDLIVSIEKINAKCKHARLGIGIFAAIRSEVKTAVASLGKEINKLLGDFGVEIRWNQPGIDEESQSLLFVIARRLEPAKSGSDVDAQIIDWGKYFPDPVNGDSPKKYLLHASWYRPRDLVRMLMMSKDQFPHETCFNGKVLKGIKKDYSRESWIEITEELKAKYGEADIDCIKKILYGLHQRFSYSDIQIKIQEGTVFNPEFDAFLNRFNLPTVLRDLYRIGAIGNVSKEGWFRFAFRGDEELLLDRDMYIHNAIKQHLS